MIITDCKIGLLILATKKNRPRSSRELQNISDFLICSSPDLGMRVTRHGLLTSSPDTGPPPGARAAKRRRAARRRAARRRATRLSGLRGARAALASPWAARGRRPAVRPRLGAPYFAVELTNGCNTLPFDAFKKYNAKRRRNDKKTYEKKQLNGMTSTEPMKIRSCSKTGKPPGPQL